MKPAAVDYVRARSLAEALDLLARPNIDARVMAGGQSLVAMMNLRVASPDLLVDIARLPELGAVTEEESTVFYGACVTHAAIEDRRVADPSRGLMPKVAEGLAYRAIRNRGTLGGSLALADPAAEWPSPLILDNASRLCARGSLDRTAAQDAIAADLARAADRQFDDFRHNLHAVAALRAVTQACA